MNNEDIIAWTQRNCYCMLQLDSLQIYVWHWRKEGKETSDREGDGQMIGEEKGQMIGEAKGRMIGGGG